VLLLLQIYENYFVIDMNEKYYFCVDMRNALILLNPTNLENSILLLNDFLIGLTKFYKKKLSKWTNFDKFIHMVKLCQHDITLF